MARKAADPDKVVRDQIRSVCTAIGFALAASFKHAQTGKEGVAVTDRWVAVADKIIELVEED